VVILRNPHMKLRFGQIGNVARKRLGILMQALTHQNPTHMGPPFPINGTVRVAFLVRKLMMNSMSGNPENRPTFERQCSADGQKVLHPFWSLVAAMRQQPMIAHSD